MLNITKIGHAGQAHAYYSEKDDYYLQDKSAAVWGGVGADRLGLRGEIKPDDLRSVLQGQAGDQQVGRPGFREVRQSDGTVKKIPSHMPGLDLTFSASKSYSIAALARGDKRLIEAHDHAVQQAMDFIEKHGAATRQRDGNGGIEHRDTSNLIYGKIRHSTNREGEPQVHTHVVVPNMTFDASTGQWRSLDTRHWRELMREADTIYQAEMGRAATVLGYHVGWRVNGDGFVAGDLAEVSQAERDALSTRSKQIDAALAGRGKTRDTSSRRERDTAALDTRAPKEHIPDSARKQQWLDKLAAITGTREYRMPNSPSQRATEQAAADAARRAVREATQHLGERAARFTERELSHHALTLGDGRVGPDDVRQAIAAARESGEIIDTTMQQRGRGGERENVAGLTSQEGQRTERDMLDSAAQIASTRATMHLSDRQIDERIRQQEKATGYQFTQEQRAATRGILGSGSRLSILQGLAGTAKTTSVMAAVADAARERGMRVRAIAPTHSAAETLGASIGAESSTVAAVNARPLDRDERKEMWLIDEAGMIAAKDMRDLLAKARRADAQVVLTGDTHQIDSVGAGRAFGQLQVQHLEVTYGLSDIKRQQNAALRQAVYDSLRGDFDAALGQVSTSEIADRDEAIRAIGDEYMRHTAAGRDTIVVPLSRQDRADANAEIQRRLEATGQVTGAQEVRTLQPTQLTGIEQADASRYRVGEVIEAHRNFRGGAKKGQFATVTGVEDGKVLARTAEGREWRFDPQRTDKFSVHERTQTRIGIGDRIVARGNLVARGDDGNQVAVKNNTEMSVEAVSDDNIAARFKDGRRVEIDTTHGAKVDLAYAQTANQAQGRTADVAIAYMRASQRNLADRQHAYVAMSRAREHATIITDSKAALAKTLGASSRGKDTALDGLRNHLDTQRPLGEYVRKWASDTASRVVEARRERKVEAERSRRMDMARRKSSQKPQERDGRAGKSAQEWEKRDAEFLSRGARERESEILDRATERTARARKAYGINVDMGVLGQLLGSKQTSRGHARLAEIRRQRDASLAQLAEAVGRAQERQMQRAEPRADVAAAGKSGKERGPKLG